MAIDYDVHSWDYNEWRFISEGMGDEIDPLVEIMDEVVDQIYEWRCYCDRKCPSGDLCDDDYPSDEEIKNFEFKARLKVYKEKIEKLERRKNGYYR